MNNTQPIAAYTNDSDAESKSRPQVPGSSKSQKRRDTSSGSKPRLANPGQASFQKLNQPLENNFQLGSPSPAAKIQMI